MVLLRTAVIFPVDVYELSTALGVHLSRPNTDVEGLVKFKVLGLPHYPFLINYLNNI